MVKRRFHHSFFQWSGSVPRMLCSEGKRILQESRKDHDGEMARTIGDDLRGPSVLSFEIRLVEQDFDEGGDDLRIKKDRGAAEDFTCDLSLCLF